MHYARKMLRKLPLKWRIVTAFSVLFVVGAWSALEFLAESQRADIERSLAEQQLALTRTIAEEIDHRISLQVLAVQQVARTFPSDMLVDPAKLSAVIASRAGIVSFFQEGIAFADPQGTVIGEAPALGRIGRDLSRLPGFTEAISGGEPVISLPYAGEQPRDPVATLWVPVKDGDGRVIGAMAGTMHLLEDRFLGRLLDRRLGETGWFYVVSPQTHTLIASHYKERILEPLPARGVNRMLDRFLDGHEGSGITVNSRGVEALTSAQTIASTGWILVASMPVTEAFHSITLMKERVAAVMTAVAGTAILMLWLVLDRFLKPLTAATKDIRDMVAGRRAPGPLGVVHGSEVGALVSSFNELQAQIVQSHEAVQRNAARIEAIFASSPVGLSFVGSDRTIFAVNAAFATIFGQRQDELVGQSARVLYGSDEDFETIGKRAYPAIRDGDTYREDIRVSRRDGSAVWLRIGGALIVPDRPDLGSVFSVEDITRQVELETVLHESEERYRLMVDGVQDYAIFMIDPSGRVASWNGGAERIKGYRADEIIGRSVECFYTAEDIADDKPQRLLSIARMTGRIEDEGWRVRKDGSRFWANVVVTALHDNQGQLRGFVRIARDLTERRKAGQEIRRLQEFQAAILAATGSAIIATNRDGLITLINPAAERLLKFRPDDLVGRQGPEIFHDPGQMADRAVELGVAPAAFLPVVGHLMEGKADGDSREWTYVRKDGSHVPVIAAWNKLALAPDEATGFIGSAQDISMLKELEVELKRSNEELERFAYVASHDLRQPLRMVSSYLGLLERRLGDRLDSDCREFIGFAVDGAKRMDRMIIDLLDYARIGRDSTHQDEVPLTDILRQAVSTLGVAIEEAQAEISLPPNLPVVPGYPSELERLFQNLLANAVKFHAEDRPPVISVTCHAGARECRISVADNGIGVAPADRDRLFIIFQRCAPRVTKATASASPRAARSSSAMAAVSGWTQSPAKGRPSMSCCPRKRSMARNHPRLNPPIPAARR